MSRHRVANDAFGAPEQSDPGNAGKIACNRSPGVFPLISAAAETRTVLDPTRPGAILCLYMRTDGGDIVVTFSTAFNEDGDTTFTFSDAGQFAIFMSVFDGTNYYWRKLADYGIGNIAPADATVLALLSTLTATVAELNNAADESVNTETLTAAGRVLTAADSGRTFFINNATGFVVATLPAPVNGMRFRFINKTANTSGNHTIVSSASANIIQGNQNSVAGDAGDTGTADDTISFVANNSLPGDKVELFSDGTSWFAYAISRVAAGMTFTQAS